MVGERGGAQTAGVLKRAAGVFGTVCKRADDSQAGGIAECVENRREFDVVQIWVRRLAHEENDSRSLMV